MTWDRGLHCKSTYVVIEPGQQFIKTTLTVSGDRPCGTHGRLGLTNPQVGPGRPRSPTGAKNKLRSKIKLIVGSDLSCLERSFFCCTLSPKLQSGHKVTDETVNDW